MPQYLRKLSKSSKWFYKFDYNGKTYFSRCIYPNKAEAKKAERDKFTELEQGTITDVKLAFLISERLNYIKAKKSERYHKNSKYYLDQFLEEFGDVEVKSISKNSLNRFLLQRSKELNTKGKDNYAVNALFRQIRALFNYAINYLDLNIKNPCQGLTLFSVKKKLKYIPTDEQIKAILGLCNDEQALLIEFLLETGVRIGEAINFTYENIHSDYIVIYTRKSRNSNQTPRKLPKPKCLGDLKGRGKVFHWTDKPYFLQEKIKKLGLPVFGYHSFRHRYASLLSRNGTPIFQIMKLLGHENLVTTQGYLRLLGEDYEK
jgi:integrase